jgi:hypothetical protein
VGANVSKVMSSLIDGGKGKEKSLIILGEDEAFLYAEEMEKLFKKVTEEEAAMSANFMSGNFHPELNIVAGFLCIIA